MINLRSVRRKSLGRWHWYKTGTAQKKFIKLSQNSKLHISKNGSKNVILLFRPTSVQLY